MKESIQMLFIIFGSNGFLGRYLYSYFIQQDKKTVGLTKKELTVDKHINVDDLEKTIVNISIKEDDTDIIVINCIGIKDIFDPDLYLVNSVFPNLLSSVCQKRHWLYIQPSPPCVFKGDKISSYDEFSMMNEQDKYVHSKRKGETDQMMILRCGLLGEKQGLLEVMKNTSVFFKGYTNHYWNGVTCLEFAKIIEQLIENKIEWKGVKHLVPEYSFSHFNLSMQINDVYELGLTVLPFPDKVYKNRVLSSKVPFTSKKMYVQTPYELHINDLETQLKQLKQFKLEMSV